MKRRTREESIGCGRWRVKAGLLFVLPCVLPCILLCVLLCPGLTAATSWAEAVEAAQAGRTDRAVELLTSLLDQGGPFDEQSLGRYETQLFAWRVELGEGSAALERLLTLPERTLALQPAAVALGRYLASNPEEVKLFVAATRLLPAWLPLSGEAASAALPTSSSVAARLAGLNPSAARPALRELAKDQRAAALVLAALEGNPLDYDVVTWRIYLDLLETARGGAEALEAVRERFKLEPERNDVRLELSRRLREGGNPAEALELWLGREFPGDNRPALEQGECHFALGQIDEAVAVWRTLLEMPPLTTGRVRQVAGVMADHSLLEQALELLEDPPTGGMVDYARQLVSFYAGVGRHESAIATALDLLEEQPRADWAFEALLGYTAERGRALTLISALERRRGEVFTRLRLEIALAPWALLSDERAGPLPHPFRPREAALLLDPAARRLLESEFSSFSREGLPDGFAPGSLHALLRRAARLGLLVETRDWTRLLADLPGIMTSQRVSLLKTGLEALVGSTLAADIVWLRGVHRQHGDDEELVRLLARRLADGGRTAEALSMLEELPLDNEVRAARALLHLRRGELDRARELLNDDLATTPPGRELLYARALVAALETGFATEPDLEAALEPARRFINLYGDDPRTTRLLRFILEASLELTGEGGGAFAPLQRAWAAELSGAETRLRRELETAAVAGGSLGREARLRLAEYLLDRGRLEEARTTLERLLEEDGEEVGDRALALAAHLYASMLDRPERAVELLIRLVEKYPRSPLLEYARRGVVALGSP